MICNLGQIVVRDRTKINWHKLSAKVPKRLDILPTECQVVFKPTLKPCSMWPPISSTLDEKKNMQKKYPKIFYLTSMVVFMAITCLVFFQKYARATVLDPIPGFCTIFTASYGDNILFGNNEDYINLATYYWVEPRSQGSYGGVYFGYDNFFPQGGINEKGLVFDANALPETRLNPHPELPSSPSEHVMKTIMKKAATVKEAIDIAKRENWGISLNGQIMLADTKGEAVVISAGAEGELAFTRKKKEHGYLVSTNFNRANPKNALSYPCWRYDKAVSMLKKVDDKNKLTVEYFKSVLDATHLESSSMNTLYSNIYDLRNGIIYLYHWHQFGAVIKLDVAEEIARGSSYTKISDLYSKKTVDSALDEYHGYKEEKEITRNFVWAWMIIVTLSLIVLIVNVLRIMRAPLRAHLVWLLLVALLGPFGLVAYFFSCRRRQSNSGLS